jgi:hypothetical protein
VPSVSLNAGDHGIAWASYSGVDGTTLNAVVDARPTPRKWTETYTTAGGVVIRPAEWGRVVRIIGAVTLLVIVLGFAALAWFGLKALKQQWAEEQAAREAAIAAVYEARLHETHREIAILRLAADVKKRQNWIFDKGSSELQRAKDGEIRAKWLELAPTDRDARRAVDEWLGVPTP